MNNEFLVGVYKEVGKPPDIVKIKNDKSYLEKLLDGEYTNIDYDDYTILYKKQSENLLANIYVDQYSKIGVSLKGKVFAVSKDEKGNFKSLNKDQAKRCITFFLRESFNYKNFDEHGRYIPRSKRRNDRKIFNNNKQNTETTESTKPPEQKQEQTTQEKTSTVISTNDVAKALNIGNQFFESKFRLEKVESNKQTQNTSNSNENQSQSTENNNSTNIPPPVIQLTDEQTLNMILKIVFIILDFVRGALADSDEDE